MAGVRSRYTTPTGPWLLTDVAHVPHTYHDHQVVFKTIFPPVAVGLLWCYPLSNALRGKPNDAAIITVKRLTLLLLEVTLPGIATSLVQVYVTIECSE